MAATGDILNTSTSGLLAFQRALAVTGHNIANVETPGYTRQRAELTARPPQLAGNGFIGTGVEVETVRRVYDEFLNGQLLASTSAFGALDANHSLAAGIDRLLADPNGGLSPAMSRFFDAVQTLANDPTSAAAREAMLSEANALTSRFHFMDSRFSDLEQGVNTRIRSAVSEINSLATSIGKLNAEIVRAEGAVGQPANDLRDQRDAILTRLSQLVSVTTLQQDDGAMNVFVGNGQTLVTGATVSKLAAVPNVLDNSRYEIAIQSGGLSTVVTDVLTGGELGGSIAFRSGTLDPSRNALGRVALGLAATINAQHRLGLDTNGNLNLDFFNTLDTSSPRVLTSSSAVLDVNITGVSEVTTSDYRLDYDGVVYRLTRLSDNAVITAFAGFPQTIASEGFSISLTSGAPAAGESFLIQPTRMAAGAINTVVGDPSRIAAAGPLRTAPTANANGLPTNLGTGKISTGSVSSTAGLPLAGPITLTFVPASNTFIVSGGPGGFIAYNPATDAAGKTYTFAGQGGFTFTLSGIPSGGDSFTITNNAQAAGDNRNLLALADLRGQSWLANGTATYDSAYGQMVSNVGTDTRNLEVGRNIQEGLLEQAQNARDSVSGVNLDEEAANLLRFQQAYQAAAQAIAVADTVFQTLIAAVRR